MIALVLAAPLCLAPASAWQEPTALEPTSVTSTIVEVTVYPGSAAVRRRAFLSDINGRFVLPGLPRSLDPSALRVRATGTEVVGVELRERLAPAASDARIEELRGKVADLEQRLAAVADERAVIQRLNEHAERLVLPELPTGSEAGVTKPSVELWMQNVAYLETLLSELRQRDRTQEGIARELRRELADLRLELGRADAQGGVRTFDLLIDVAAVNIGSFVPNSIQVEVDYVVPDASWTPVYDLRAPEDLSAVELVYRARVQQRTGEDWRDVSLLLSTAEPRRGAQGPEPQSLWVGVHDPRQAYSSDEAPASVAFSAAAPKEDMDNKDVLAGLGYLEASRSAYANVQSEGLSLRYRLPAKETVESRSDASTVLVGRAPLELAPEHYCIPELDPTVWLRAEATNTSDFVILPGRAAVYLGADFLGHANLGTVQRDETFFVPLGADPGVTVERTLLTDMAGETGVIRSRRTTEESWRVELKNHGAFTDAADGAVRVIVHEALPRPTDDRIEVELEEVRPKLAEGERWKTLRQEKGALTWIVPIARGGAATIEHTVTISYPEDSQLRRRVDR